MRAFLAGAGTAAVIIMAIVSIMRWNDFKSNCGDYLKLAGDAPTVARAYNYLDLAVTHMERKRLTSGNSAYLFHTPKNDVGVWYDQVKGARETAASILERLRTDSGSVTQLEQDNALMKIREVVLDEGKDGTKVTAPDNIARFPNQWAFLVLWTISLAVAAIGWIWYAIVSGW